MRAASRVAALEPARRRERLVEAGVGRRRSRRRSPGRRRAASQRAGGRWRPSRRSGSWPRRFPPVGIEPVEQVLRLAVPASSAGWWPARLSAASDGGMAGIDAELADGYAFAARVLRASRRQVTAVVKFTVHAIVVDARASTRRSRPTCSARRAASRPSCASPSASLGVGQHLVDAVGQVVVVAGLEQQRRRRCPRRSRPARRCGRRWSARRPPCPRGRRCRTARTATGSRTQPARCSMAAQLVVGHEPGEMRRCR